MNKKSVFIVLLTLFACVIVVLALPTDVNVNVDGVLPAINTTPATAVVHNTATTSAPVQNQPVAQAPANTESTPVGAPSANNGDLTETKEIIDQYTLLVNKFKQEKPAYKKKEYQVLPEEYRNFGSAGNLIIEIASGYLTSEESCEELIRSAGSEDIKWDMPIHNTDVGCVLTDYSAVEWAKCEDVGDGTKKISFALKEEMNCEPTPADTLVPVSNHGAVMQPLSRKEILDEVENITSKFPIITLNDFTLGYRDCVFECVYNPETDQVLSITHHVVIDINADLSVTLADVAGSARLLNEMFIYDITW